MNAQGEDVVAGVRTPATIDTLKDIAPEAYKDFAFTLKGMKRINYIRSVDPMAYAYLVKALQLLQPQGYFTDSIL